MAVSELHSRLEHLVTYSSQLIFVSGDSVASQQRSLQAFISQQSENTEIAFLTAEAQGTLSNYRKEIVRQLLGPKAPVINRPLNELLSALNQHNGPVLICLCQAEHLPQGFLQELWELVLQSRFAANKQHLNVLLFGEQQWAEQAKAWLPANNRERPLLLSTESVNTHILGQTELDKMIAEKRKMFEQRMHARAQRPEEPPSTIANPLFKALLFTAFMAVFGSLVAWQYSDEISQLVGEYYQNEVPEQTATANQLPAPVESTPEIVIAAEPPLTQPEEAVDEATQQPVPQNTVVESDKPNEAVTQENDQQLITDWQSAIEDIDNKPATDPEIVELQAAQPVATFDEKPLTGETIEQAPVSDAVPEDVIESDDNLEEFPQDNTTDYPVEDIVSVEQLPASSVPPQTVSGSTPQPEQSEPEQAPEELVTVLPDELQSPLLSIEPDRFVLQVAGMASKSTLDEFITDNNLNDLVWIYTTQRYGGDWHVLIYQSSYPDLASAREDAANLPEVLRRGTPFAKRVSQVQSEIQVNSTL